MRRRAQALKAVLSIDSQVGKGTTVILKLPLEAPDWRKRKAQLPG
jgi:nitrate/nitrite-specific signal transduction histidine kinase